MDLENLERLAMAGQELPKELNLPDQWLFLCLRLLYAGHRAGLVAREQARLEKLQMLATYRTMAFWAELFQEAAKERNRMAGQLAVLNKCSCAHCRKAIELFDGRAINGKGVFGNAGSSRNLPGLRGGQGRD